MKMEWRSLPAPARLISLIAEIKIKILFHSSTQSYFYNIFQSTNGMKLIELVASSIENQDFQITE